MLLVNYFACLLTASCIINLEKLFAIRLDMQYCGFEQTCGGRSVVNASLSSCCRQCECEDICLERGTCCKDKAGLNDTKVYIKQECKAGAYLKERVPTNLNLQSFFARTRCPSSFENREIKNRCESDNVKSVHDITFVSSSNGAVVYKNVFCALCHEDKRTVEWEIMALSENFGPITQMQNLNNTLITDQILANPIVFKPPANLNYGRTVCFEESSRVNKCNSTGNWEFFDSELQNLCLHPPESAFYIHVMFVKRNKRTVVFDNLYCFLCNVGANVNISSCQDIWNSRYQDVWFSKLINTQLWIKAETEDTELICKSSEVHDTFFDRCRQLYCPRFSLPSNGRCVIYHKMDLCYQAAVILNPIGETLNVSDSVKQNLKSQYMSILRKLGFGKNSVCFVAIFLKNERETSLEAIEKVDDRDTLRDVHVLFSIKETRTRTLEDMWTKFTYIQRSKNIRILLNNFEVPFHIRWTETRSMLNEFKVLQYKTFDFKKKAVITFGSSCPRVLLSIDEYKKVVESHPNADDLLIAPNLGDKNTTVSVCFDQYYRAAQLATSIKKEMSFILTLVFILCLSKIGYIAIL